MFENTSKCEDCLYYEYDDEYGFYVCDMDLDEDETPSSSAAAFKTARTTAPATNTPSSANKYNNIV